MREHDTILDEIYAIRRKLYDETKDMSSAERTAYLKCQAELAAQEFGLQIVDGVSGAKHAAN